MRKVLLMVVGLAGLALLCGTGELLAQTDTGTNAGNTVNGNASDSRLQGMPTQNTDQRSSGASSATNGVGGSGTVGTAGSTGSLPSGSAQPAGETGAGTAGMQQSVLQLQQEVAQLRQELAQVRTQLDTLSANTGAGGSGQAGVAPSGSQAGANAESSTGSSGTEPPGAVAGGTSPGEPLRAGTAQETGAHNTAAQGRAVVNVIYTGTVRSVSAGRLELLDEEGKPFTVELGKQTVVLRKGQHISAEELKEGTRVRAVVDMISGHNQAKEVTTLPAK